MYITRLASNQIVSPSSKTQREVRRPYLCRYSLHNRHYELNLAQQLLRFPFQNPSEFHGSLKLAWGTRSCSWLSHCATSRKVAGSIPDCVIGIFHWHNSSGRNMALGLTQPLTEMSIRNISWGCKGGRCVRLTTLPHSSTDSLEIWEHQTLGTLRSCPGL
jgi:hypothetical protein